MPREEFSVGVFGGVPKCNFIKHPEEKFLHLKVDMYSASVNTILPKISSSDPISTQRHITSGETVVGFGGNCPYPLSQPDSLREAHSFSF